MRCEKINIKDKSELKNKSILSVSKEEEIWITENEEKLIQTTQIIIRKKNNLKTSRKCILLSNKECYKHEVLVEV